MEVVDSFLIIKQSQGVSLFSIFSLPDCKHICDFGKKGHGPGEFIYSFDFCPLYCEKSGFVVSNKLISLNYYQIEDLINEKFMPYKVIYLPPKLNRFREITAIGDSLIFGASYGGNMEMFKFNNISNTLECFREFPDNYPEMSNEHKTNLYAYFLASKPDNTQFVRVYESQGKIEVFNLNSNKTIIIKYKNFPSLEENLHLDNSSRDLRYFTNQKIFCWGIQATNKYIYLRVYNDNYTNIVGDDDLLRTFIPDIHVFDWNGNPIAKIKISEYFDYYCVDLNDDYIFTCDGYYSDIICRYRITNYLKQ
ncbi:MAG TPA: BF3164 family lipoprotein [Prolixibacteraceae bacterium]|nr:BF3164 family lipoprotein [Prolixibacteraceae bacterium]